MIIHENVFDKKWTNELASSLIKCKWKADNVAGRKTHHGHFIQLG